MKQNVLSEAVRRTVAMLAKVTIVTLALVFGMVLVGCDKGATGARALVGTWESDYGITWSFTGDKFTQSMYGVKQTVSYKIKGNAISTEYQGVEVEMEFEIDGDTLSIEVMGFVLEFKRVE
ncbi:MAG: hypothetical protein LBT11_05910 [Treponema sp.]|jgi:uncharacterized lipoprotein YehR (DUF1307 family)|nr:hypothetical protein [Treponema sp.]